MKKSNRNTVSFASGSNDDDSSGYTDYDPNYNYGSGKAYSPTDTNMAHNRITPNPHNSIMPQPPGGLLVDPLSGPGSNSRPASTDGFDDEERNLVVREEEITNRPKSSTKKKQVPSNNNGASQNLLVVAGAIILLLVLIIGLLAGLLIFELTRNDDHHTHPSPTAAPRPLKVPPTAAPTTELEYLNFLPDSTAQKIVSDASSPQAKAWDWLQLYPNYSSLYTWRKKQLMGLGTFYYSTGGDRGRWANTNWMVYGRHECNWMYLKCSTNRRITSLSMEGGQKPKLTGSLPPELGLLNTLKHLHISGYSGLADSTLPTQLGMLTALTHMAFMNNQLAGDLPTELGKLTDMRYMAVNNNNLLGSLPEELGQITRLASLLLYDNRFWGPLPMEWTKLRNLQYLWLYDNQLEGYFGPILSLTSLVSLRLENNRFQGQLPTTLGALKELKWLNLSNNQFQGRIPAFLARLNSLEAIDLTENQLTGWLPVTLCTTAVPNLKSVKVDSLLCGGSVVCPTNCPDQCGCDKD